MANKKGRPFRLSGWKKGIGSDFGIEADRQAAFAGIVLEDVEIDFAFALLLEVDCSRGIGSDVFPVGCTLNPLNMGFMALCHFFHAVEGDFDASSLVADVVVLDGRTGCFGTTGNEPQDRKETYRQKLFGHVSSPFTHQKKYRPGFEDLYGKTEISFCGDFGHKKPGKVSEKKFFGCPSRLLREEKRARNTKIVSGYMDEEAFLFPWKERA